MSLARTLVPALAAVALAACGGGSDDTTDPGKPDLGGVFIDINFGGETAVEDVPAPGDNPVQDPGGKDLAPGVDLAGYDPGPYDPGPYDPGQGPDLAVPDPGPADTGPVDNGVPCTNPVSSHGLIDQCDQTLKDPATGLTWTQDVSSASTVALARTYCQTLGRAGGGWRVPSIDELRGLVLGCPATAEGGSCGVTKTCFQTTCYDATACGGCTIDTGGGTNGCFQDEFFNDTCGQILWSNTQVPAAFAGDVRSWYVEYWDAALNSPPAGSTSVSGAVRCVKP